MYFSRLSFLTVAMLAITSSVLLPSVVDAKEVYTWPVEDGRHEATWLQWPHNYGWDSRHKQRYQGIWIKMAKALHKGEKVRIIVYNRREKNRLVKLLKKHKFKMSQIQIFIHKTDDVWVRDNGPIFALNQEGELVVQDWGFNGWGGKADYFKDDVIPAAVAKDLNKDRVAVAMINEGGSIESDGKGTLMLKRSSVLNKNRNPGMSQKQAEEYFRKYLGVTNFIWLDGIPGIDITDDHIDGTARFANGNTIVALNRYDWLPKSDYDKLVAATNAQGKKYKIVHLPMTAAKVPGVGDYGLYTNYYVGNNVIIFPVYGDKNDDKAAKIIQALYPKKRLVKILINELYKDGGAAHCVTMQQPAVA